MTGKDIDKCFSNFEENNVDSSILYDNCISELCHRCNDSNPDDCVPEETIQLFQNVCAQNGVKM